MKRILSVLCAVTGLVLSGCGFFPIVRGSGRMATLPVSSDGFSRVAAMQTFEVHVVPDSVTSIEITCDENLRDYLVVRKDAPDSLVIGLQQGYIYTGVTLRAEVHVPVLTAVELSGASRAVVEPGFVSAGPFRVTLSGASQADLRGLTCGALTADVSGASILAMGGTSGGQVLTVSGASEAHLLDLSSPSAAVSLSGASSCWLTVGSGSIDLSASGASTLYYRGSPSFPALDLSGVSRVIRIN